MNKLTLKHLRLLNLENNCFVNVDGFSNFKQLQALNLNSNQIRDINQFAKLTSLSALTDLKIENNPLLQSMNLDDFNKELCYMYVACVTFSACLQT